MYVDSQLLRMSNVNFINILAMSTYIIQAYSDLSK